MWFISGGIFFGWALGSNDAANVFGTAVASKIIKYRTAVILAAIFILLGAVVEGQEGIERIGGLTTQTGKTAFLTVIAAGVTVTIMTTLKLPVSASQAFLGALIGMGLITDVDAIQWSQVLGMLMCWVGTPIGAALLALLLYPLLARFLLMLRLNLPLSAIEFLFRSRGCHSHGSNRTLLCPVRRAGEHISGHCWRGLGYRLAQGGQDH
jgi:PiT family inorganic phosphate transporter